MIFLVFSFNFKKIAFNTLSTAFQQVFNIWLILFTSCKNAWVRLCLADCRKFVKYVYQNFQQFQHFQQLTNYEQQGGYKTITSIKRLFCVRIVIKFVSQHFSTIFQHLFNIADFAYITRWNILFNTFNVENLWKVNFG